MKRMTEADIQELRRQYGTWEKLARAAINTTRVSRKALELPSAFHSKRGPKAGRKTVFDRYFYSTLRGLVIAKRRRKEHGKRISEAEAIRKILDDKPTLKERKFTRRDFHEVYKKYNELKNAAKVDKKVLFNMPAHVRDGPIPDWQLSLANMPVPNEANDPSGDHVA